MNAINFFVHPEYSLKLGSEIQKEYLIEIKAAMENSENPVLVNSQIRFPESWYGKQVEEMKNFCKFDELFPEDRILTSHCFEIDGPKRREFYPFGYVQEDNFEKLRDLIGNSNEPIVINGCFYGDACLLNLVFQILGLTAEGANLYALGDTPGSPQNEACDKARQRILNENYLERTNVRYGVCFRPSKIRILNPRISSLEEQLVTSETRLHKPN